VELEVSRVLYEYKQSRGFSNDLAQVRLVQPVQLAPHHLGLQVVVICLLVFKFLETLWLRLVRYNAFLGYAIIY
jgi:hypothetical protein